MESHVVEEAEPLAKLVGLVEGVKPAILHAYGVVLVAKLLERNKIMLRRDE